MDNLLCECIASTSGHNNIMKSLVTNTSILQTHGVCILYIVELQYGIGLFMSKSQMIQKFSAKARQSTCMYLTLVYSVSTFILTMISLILNVHLFEDCSGCSLCLSVCLLLP